ncbi:uncharacterized protein Eint_030260 [Encephalitozoon intestinalis ATCC 50506]|uniref:Transcription regulator Rua1 C-terminal domain-containing protein n=1 Tax=Encephalitozoon intestinalis (strain ATCC 50506) TaxID=876142 RepID=E0S636_ENCIT|nr:uncharacterized protein Eint_030260 [Encephalitozoon intestinalis ATCC 50506]ADM11171.1 hypothetical protein Eint_030260 [Encephalitozoon intestinalis ATCC 50506]UTX44837.1 DUF4451 domain-containing protein [Encephalitozoon intestinalis]
MSSSRSVLYLDEFLLLDTPYVSEVLLDPREFYELDDIYSPTELNGNDLLREITVDAIGALSPWPREIKRQPEDGDIYKPKKVRGAGKLREGYCGMCNLWLKLKTSSYWYHMNYKHGISSKGSRYPEPQVRHVGNRTEGFCTICSKWIVLGHKASGRSTRFGWFKHCQKSHGSSKTI